MVGGGGYLVCVVGWSGGGGVLSRCKVECTKKLIIKFLIQLTFFAQPNAPDSSDVGPARLVDNLYCESCSD